MSSRRPSSRRRRRAEFDDDIDDSPIPLRMPAPNRSFCELITTRIPASCIGENCPITLDPITENNAVSFRCHTGRGGETIACFNMFALLVTLYNDRATFDRRPQLPTNRTELSERDLDALTSKVVRRLQQGYASDETHDDYQYAEEIRQLLNRN